MFPDMGLTSKCSPMFCFGPHIAHKGDVGTNNGASRHGKNHGEAEHRSRHTPQKEPNEKALPPVSPAGGGRGKVWEALVERARVFKDPREASGSPGEAKRSEAPKPLEDPHEHGRPHPCGQQQREKET